MFQNIYNDKTVLLTGHTGFKGSWLSLWLKKLGAKVIGVGLDPINENSFFSVNNICEFVDDNRFDIRNLEKLKNLIKIANPDFVFHLAAQPLVRKSYSNPLETWSTNLIGTLNVLESLRELNKKCACVIITSDKCYQNNEWVWGYRESDKLGGSDPYSASKACAEFGIKSYFESFFNNEQQLVRITSARAGNVIGGGDWSEDRIVPDCIRAWSKGVKVQLRSPNSTRPWQHVLEPLSGYLLLASNLYRFKKFNGHAFNFGPRISENYSVLELVEIMGKYWEKVMWEDCSDNNVRLYESGLLKLNCEKALDMLNWNPTLHFDETIRFTVEWYKEFFEFNENICKKSSSQIDEYIKFAEKCSQSWTK
tara:strand:- start:171 stop:1265 length:1095 start_codon:yes stop_codon:yes gene_type:complete